MIFLCISDAQRLATRELKEQLAVSAGRGKKKRKGNRLSNDNDDDGDGGFEESVQNQVKRGYLGGSGGNGGAIGNQRGSNYKKTKKSRRGY